MRSSLVLTRSTSSGLFPPLDNLNAVRTSLNSCTRKVWSSNIVSAYDLSNDSIVTLVQLWIQQVGQPKPYHENEVVSIKNIIIIILNKIASSHHPSAWLFSTCTQVFQ